MIEGMLTSAFQRLCIVHQNYFERAGYKLNALSPIELEALRRRKL